MGMQPRLSAQELRNIAGRQRRVLICILIDLGAIAWRFSASVPMARYANLALLAAGVAMTVLIFMLASKVYGTAVAIVAGVLAFVPVLGLAALLVVNGKATEILKSHGIPVGLMGADESKIM